MIRVSSLKWMVELQGPVKTASPDGVPTTSWQTLGNCHAGKRGLTGKEYFAAGAQQQEDLVIFYFRRGIALTPEMRIVHEGTAYDIYSIRLVEEDRYQEVRARVRKVLRA